MNLSLEKKFPQYVARNVKRALVDVQKSMLCRVNAFTAVTKRFNKLRNRVRNVHSASKGRRKEH